ncbi:MAG: UDP-N-acetylglucosamine 2-epimerase (non-hydrolyzing) [Candidatus Aminicenantes bacterium]|nr:UDP-N-acetylglucosamine 2-epimerase (non-hydrolyzing) [Candidatus Aminicenantes bacterium]
MNIALVLGTRPQIIKSASLINEAVKHSELNLQIIHTGQHYDYELSKLFFDELNLPDPIVELNVGSGSHGWQTGKMLIELEKALVDIKPDIVLVPGDTNSTLAGALAAAKMQINVGHLEAGARSYDMNMPEEINRRLTDHCSSFLFTVSENCKKTLLKEGIIEEKISTVGDTMYDALLNHMPKIEASKIIEKLNLEKDEYAILTTHRQENVDNKESLCQILQAVLELDELKIIFPVHPRTERRLKETSLISKLEKTEHIKLVSPLGYHEMLKLIKYAKLIITDSGGIQKEAYWLETPCLTIRKNTEWIETVELGANLLVGVNKIKIVTEGKRILNESKYKFENKINPYGDGKAAEKIINILLQKSDIK